jgi:hypothetical protein
MRWLDPAIRVKLAFLRFKKRISHENSVEPGLRGTENGRSHTYIQRVAGSDDRLRTSSRKCNIPKTVAMCSHIVRSALGSLGGDFSIGQFGGEVQLGESVSVVLGLRGPARESAGRHAVRLAAGRECGTSFRLREIPAHVAALPQFANYSRKPR